MTGDRPCGEAASLRAEPKAWGGSFFVFPRRAGLAVLEEDARRLELLADPVGLRILFRRPRGAARLDPCENLPLPHAPGDARSLEMLRGRRPQQAEDGEQRVEQFIP